jgi:hypothetical protein
MHRIAIRNSVRKAALAAAPKVPFLLRFLARDSASFDTGSSNRMLLPTLLVPTRQQSLVRRLLRTTKTCRY